MDFSKYRMDLSNIRIGFKEQEKPSEFIETSFLDRQTDQNFKKRSI